LSQTSGFEGFQNGLKLAPCRAGSSQDVDIGFSWGTIKGEQGLCVKFQTSKMLCSQGKKKLMKALTKP